MAEHRTGRSAKRDDTTASRDTQDTVLAMAMLWAIPVVTFLFMLART